MAQVFYKFFYVPALLLIGLFIVYPFLSGIRFSLTNWNGFSQSYDFIGFKNYVHLFKDANYRTAFINTFIYGVGSTILQQALGLSYALLLNKTFIGRLFARTVVYLPVLISGIIMGYIWYFLFRYNRGALNDILQWLSLEKIDWLGDARRAISIIVAVNTLQYVGISMVIYLAGMQSIPRMYYEAAAIDGGTARNTFFRITLPLLQPALVTSVTINLIGGLKLFEIIKSLTNGGPGYASHSMSTLIQFTYFQNQLAGYSAAMGVVLFLVITLVTLFVLKLFEKMDVEY